MAPDERILRDAAELTQRLKARRVMPTLRDKKWAVDICHEIQPQISNYRFSVSLINLGLGLIVGCGLFARSAKPAVEVPVHGLKQPI